MMRELKGGRRVSHKAWRDGGRLTFKKRDSEGRHLARETRELQALWLQTFHNHTTFPRPGLPGMG
jgi:hypothetical protein